MNPEAKTNMVAVGNRENSPEPVGGQRILRFLPVHVNINPSGAETGILRDEVNNHGSWCPGSLRRQAISNLSTGYVG